MPAQPHFTPAFFQFLRQLAKNNTRDWFLANKPVYERDVKAPTLRFIEDVRPRMAKAVGPHIRVDAKAMQRMNRDTRFGKDKSPYKTAVGLMFPHQKAGELMLGYHLTLGPGKGVGEEGCKAYAGIWEPDGPTLEAIRTRIMVKPDDWRKAVGGAFAKRYVFEGESLKRPPKVGDCPVDADHPLIDDLKRKSHAAAAVFDEKEVCRTGFLDDYIESVKVGAPLMKEICKAAGVPW